MVEQELRARQVMAAADASGISLNKVMRPSCLRFWNRARKKVGRQKVARSNFWWLPVCFIRDDAVGDGFGAAILIGSALGASAFVGVADVATFDEDCRALS